MYMYNILRLLITYSNQILQLLCTLSESEWVGGGHEREGGREGWTDGHSSDTAMHA